MLRSRAFAARAASRSLRTQQRRYDSSNTPSGHAAGAGHHEPTHHGHHPAPVNESFGRGFYITIASIPLFFAVYSYSRSSNAADQTSPEAQPVLTRIINSYTSYRNTWTERNTLHTQMIEQAAHDRNLFQSSPHAKNYELKFPEVFNTGSPFNVVAGSQANLDELIAHYEKKNAEADEKQMRKMNGGSPKERPADERIVRGGTY
ncbi:hypothetical protein MMC09_002865 [Bachmanniomyces sp. S44760]|nr:hypothetical protein [Bachmanniomyces sp. S44760]